MKSVIFGTDNLQDYELAFGMLYNFGVDVRQGISCIDGEREYVLICDMPLRSEDMGKQLRYIFKLAEMFNKKNVIMIYDTGHCKRYETKLGKITNIGIWQKIKHEEATKEQVYTLDLQEMKYYKVYNDKKVS